MKKTLITLFALTAASVASATEYTITTGQWGANNGTYYGWSNAISGPEYLTPSATLPEMVTLDSITLVHQANRQGSLYDGSKLAIFTFSDSGTVGSFVGISDNTVTSPAAGNYTYTFTGVNLTSATQYRFLFVDDAATAADFSTAADADNKAAWQALAGTMRLQAQELGASYAAGAGLVTNSDLALYTENYKPDVTYKVSDVVPEPATATLSLLALAGLAARRRRK